MRRRIIRDALGVGIATGAYGLSFGAVSIAAGLSVAQTCVLSLLMFTGGSQFALVGVAGSPAAGAGTAVLLGARNAFYGLRMAPVLRVRRAKRLLAAQLVIDESTAMAVAQPRDDFARLAFWATGTSIYALWNLSTLAGALAGESLSDPKVLGLDAAIPAAFIALLAPQIRGREPWVVAAIAVAVALLSTPIVPAGVPVLLAASVAVLAGARRPA